MFSLSITHKFVLQVAVDTFIDNMATLGIERWLLHDLSALLPPESIWAMNDDEVAAIGAEAHDAETLRRKLKDQVAVLQTAVRICRRHARQGAPGGKP